MFFFAFVRTSVATMKTNGAPRQPSRGTPREARELLCSAPPWALEDKHVSDDMLETELVTDTYSVQVQKVPRRKQGKLNATSTDFCSKKLPCPLRTLGRSVRRGKDSQLIIRL